MRFILHWLRASTWAPRKLVMSFQLTRNLTRLWIGSWSGWHLKNFGGIGLYLSKSWNYLVGAQLEALNWLIFMPPSNLSCIFSSSNCQRLVFEWCVPTYLFCITCLNWFFFWSSFPGYHGALKVGSKLVLIPDYRAFICHPFGQWATCINLRQAVVPTTELLLRRFRNSGKSDERRDPAIGAFDLGRRSQRTQQRILCKIIQREIQSKWMSN